jgi:hypothetical protein
LPEHVPTAAMPHCNNMHRNTSSLRCNDALYETGEQNLQARFTRLSDRSVIIARAPPKS